MNVGIDMMGGDFAPLEAVKGVQLYLSGHNIPAKLTLIGDKEKLETLLNEHNTPLENIAIVHAEQIIGMHEHPTKALKEKQQSSIAIGFQLLASGKMDAFISAGNTGAMLVGALFSIKALEGVIIENPRVGLINVGEEGGKGNLLAQATYPLLKENKHINFIGNIEGRDVLLDKADVMVCEGFTGNIILKLAESLYEISNQKKVTEAYFERFNFENYGGTPVLGVAKPVIIGHGISGSKAFMNMIQLAQLMIEKKLMEKMKEELS